REYEGSVLRSDSHVFLDVTWLAEVLHRLLNLKGSETDDDTGIVRYGDRELEKDSHKTSLGRLEERGILDPSFAYFLWGDFTGYVLDTLERIGLTFPLPGDEDKGLVVLLRFPESCPDDVREVLDNISNPTTFTIGWKMFGGLPPGFLEKLIAQCCKIGTPEPFWRFGVLVRGKLGGGDREGEDSKRDFSLQLEYFHEKTEVQIIVGGDARGGTPWAVLSYAVSSVLSMTIQYPGLRWEAHLKCPDHPEEPNKMKISSEARHPGDHLVDKKTRCMRCHPTCKDGSNHGAVAVKVLKMIDIAQGEGGMDVMMKEISFPELGKGRPDTQPA
ncbi:unnamed protein product, partial [Discosporangium mesarthrocarpum]